MYAMSGRNDTIVSAGRLRRASIETAANNIHNDIERRLSSISPCSALIV
ncbi:hypothetical protein ANO14919_033680 [Xylariales sp. No.14919]|nr:hypothetical protein ANO14919_033680 [Xylariales sp. No.14919]